MPRRMKESLQSFGIAYVLMRHPVSLLALLAGTGEKQRNWKIAA